MKVRLVIQGKRRLRYKGKKKYMWHLIASNGRVLCHDGRQDYNNAADAADMAVRILNGDFQGKYTIEGITSVSEIPVSKQ